MAEPVACPNCSGRGEVIGGYRKPGFTTIWVTCYRCKGSGECGVPESAPGDFGRNGQVTQ